jgi:hypothetical protein
MRNVYRRRGVSAAAAVLAVLALVYPVTAFDAEATFAKGTTVFGVQAGGGVANNIEGHRTLSDISFLNAAPRVSYLFFSPFGSGLLRSALEPGVEGWVPVLPLPERSHRRGPQARDAVSSDRLRAAEGDRLGRYLPGRGRRGPGVLHHGHGCAQCGLSLPAHLERTHLEPEPGLQLRHRDRWRRVLFQERAP